MSTIKRGFQSGFSLVELAVATTLFSMGLGSLSIMLLSAVHGTAEARHQTMASLQANSLAEMIAMSSDAYGHYINPGDSATEFCGGNACPGVDMASATLAEWQNRIRNDLPGGMGLVCRDNTPDDGDSVNPSCDGSGDLVIKVFWTEARHQDSEGGGQRRVVSRLAW